MKIYVNEREYCIEWTSPSNVKLFVNDCECFYVDKKRPMKFYYPIRSHSICTRSWQTSVNTVERKDECANVNYLIPLCQCCILCNQIVLKLIRKWVSKTYSPDSKFVHNRVEIYKIHSLPKIREMYSSKLK